MAVTKTVAPESIREAYAAGIRLFGENRVQEFAGKRDALRDLVDCEWHLIGHLQSNKAAHAAEMFAAVDSLDSLKLAGKLNAAAEKMNKALPVLLEINIGNEDSKAGFLAGSSELESILTSATDFRWLLIKGIMAVPPLADDPESARPFFRKLRALRDSIAARRLAGVGMDVLSMGMSHDFEIAVEEGSTCVRVGSAIFGERPKK